MLDTDTKIFILSKLSHKLKKPVHEINSISRYLNDNWGSLSKDQRKGCLASIIETSYGLTDLLDSMLSDSRNKNRIKFYFERINVVQVTKLIVEKCKNLYLAKNEIEIDIETNIEHCFTMIDKFWIDQLLINLISSAAYHSNRGRITVFVRQEKAECIISIIDERPELSQEELDRMFDSFYVDLNGMQTGGAGIVMSPAICREIVEAHNGKIFASNNPDKGLTVEFSIPILDKN